MKSHIYLACNSEKIRKELESLGFSICICASYKDAKWLSIYYKHETLDSSVHGTGYGCECECDDQSFNKCMMCAIDDCIKYKEIIQIFPDINSLKKFLNL